MEISISDAKNHSALKAVEEVRDGMIVGLGSGSTAKFAIDHLACKVREGMQIRAIASSILSEKQARVLGIPLIDFSGIDKIDLYLDGADEVDENFNLIKGGGGALVREKILAANSDRFIVIVDESKLVKNLGKFPVAVEIIPYGYHFTRKKLADLGCTASLRYKNFDVFISDNGNFIVDCTFQNIEDPVLLNEKLNSVPGVVESGLFESSLVDSLIAGYRNGEVKILK
jgi:ribose 5-phosphate isomerase A